MNSSCRSASDTTRTVLPCTCREKTRLSVPTPRAAQIIGYAEAFGITGKPGRNRIGHIIVGLEAAGPDRGTDRRAHVLRARPERAHGLHRAAEDVRDAAAPAAVHGCGDARTGVAQEHGDAVRREDRKRESRPICNKRVRLVGDGREQLVPVGL